MTATASSAPTLPPIAGVILAGGRGQRMGGADKGLLPLAGKPLAAWVCTRLQPQVTSLAISANRNGTAYARFCPTVFADTRSGYEGPLAGLLSAMQHAAHPLLACVPCDSPCFPTDLVARLYTALEAAGAELAVVRCDGRLHPVFNLCRRELAPRLEAFLASGQRRFMDWCAAVQTVEVDFDAPPEAFANLNTPEDLAHLEATFANWR